MNISRSNQEQGLQTLNRHHLRGSPPPIFDQQPKLKDNTSHKIPQIMW